MTGFRLVQPTGGEMGESDGQMGWDERERRGIGGSIEDAGGINVARMIREDEEIQEDMGERRGKTDRVLD